MKHRICAYGVQVGITPCLCEVAALSDTTYSFASFRSRMRSAEFFDGTPI